MEDKIRNLRSNEESKKEKFPGILRERSITLETRVLKVKLRNRGRSSFLKTRVEKRKVSYPSKPGFNKKKDGARRFKFQDRPQIS